MLNDYEYFDSYLSNIRNFQDNKGIGISEEQALKNFINYSDSFDSTIDMFVMGEEHYWRSNSKIVILPPSVQYINTIRSATTSEIKKFTLPFESFMLAMPIGVEHNKQQMPGLMVTYMDSSTLIKKGLKRLLKKHKITISETGKTGKYLFISYRYYSVYEDKKIPCYFHIYIPEDRLNTAIRCDNGKDFFNEFSPVWESYGKDIGNELLTHDESEMQAEIAKLVIKLGFYSLSYNKQIDSISKKINKEACNFLLLSETEKSINN